MYAFSSETFLRLPGGLPLVVDFAGADFAVDGAVLAPAAFVVLAGAFETCVIFFGKSGFALSLAAVARVARVALDLAVGLGAGLTGFGGSDCSSALSSAISSTFSSDAFALVVLVAVALAVLIGALAFAAAFLVGAAFADLGGSSAFFARVAGFRVALTGAGVSSCNSSSVSSSTSSGAGSGSGSAFFDRVVLAFDAVDLVVVDAAGAFVFAVALRTGFLRNIVSASSVPLVRAPPRVDTMVADECVVAESQKERIASGLEVASGVLSNTRQLPWTTTITTAEPSRMFSAHVTSRHVTLPFI